MSENDKDNKDFEFIKEQVIEKKRRKIKKKLMPLGMTILLAIVFGLIAALTFVIAEPKLYKLLNKEEETKTPVTFPSKNPENPDMITPTISPTPVLSNNGPKEGGEPDPVIIEQSIDADLEDYINIFDDIRTVAYDVNKSIVSINSTIVTKDWFGTEVERTMNTTGLIIANNNADLLILVSLDRVKTASSIKIELSDTIAVDAVLQDYDNETNLAIITVPVLDIPEVYRNNLKVAELGESYSLIVGSPIIALGNPNGHLKSLEVGIITSRDNWATITDYKIDLFNTNLNENENSDGVIVNTDGEVIGIITRTLKDELSKELSTVIGISKLKPLIERMSNQTPRIYFGVKAEDMKEVTKLAHQVTNGIYVSEVLATSPAFNAGMKNGDIILKINDQSIMNTTNFYNAIANHKPGELVTVKVMRTTGATQKEISLSVVLEQKEK